MPYVKRDKQGSIVAVSQEPGPGFAEELREDDLAVAEFLTRVSGQDSSLGATDQDLIRVLEDLVELLIGKGVILFTELPESAQAKIMRRQHLRSELGGKLDLIGDD